MTAISEDLIYLPNKLCPIFHPIRYPRGAVRYRGAHGGRGSAKSFSFALMAAIWGYSEKLRILCTREFQASIKESFHAELKNAIASVPWLAESYDVGVDYLRNKETGTEFIFRGLRHNISNIKSLAQIDLCIIEEAEDIPEQGWIDLEPTIRADKSEIWAIWNPRTISSPVDVRLRQKPPPRSLIVEMNWRDNRKFPAVLEEQRIHAKATMSESRYNHVWEGAYLTEAEAQIYHFFKRVKHHSPRTIQQGDRLHIGLDFNVGGCCATTWVIDGLNTTAVDEFVSHDTQDVINNLTRYRGHHYTVYPDASGGSPHTNASTTDIHLLKGAGVVVDCPNSNPAVRDRINAVNAMLATSRMYVNTEKCPELTNALEMHAYNDRGDPTKYTVHPALDDWNDGMGYFIHRKFPIASPQMQKIRLGGR